MFTLEQCAAEALAGDYLLAHSYRVSIPLTHLVPDLLLTDLPNDMKVDHSQFDFNPRDPTSVLGRGGSGKVGLGTIQKRTFRHMVLYGTSKNKETFLLKCMVN